MVKIESFLSHRKPFLFFYKINKYDNQSERPYKI